MHRKNAIDMGIYFTDGTTMLLKDGESIKIPQYAFHAKCPLYNAIIIGAAYDYINIMDTGGEYDLIYRGENDVYKR